MTFWHHVAHHVASFVGWTGCTSFQTRNSSGPDASMYIGQWPAPKLHGAKRT